MRKQNRFVDLRVLLVHPDQGAYDLLQMTLEQFRFDRFTHVQNTESARDQLCFNSFDLIILSELLPAESISDLLKNIEPEELNGAKAIEVLCLSPEDRLIIEKPKLLNVYFFSEADNSHALASHLQKIFMLSEKKRVKPEFAQGRAANQNLVEEKR